MFVIGAILIWALDRLLAHTALYRVVWHLSLFRTSLLVCIWGGLSLAVYR